jgi:hypothetical protein
MVQDVYLLKMKRANGNISTTKAQYTCLILINVLGSVTLEKLSTLRKGKWKNANMKNFNSKNWLSKDFLL